MAGSEEGISKNSQKGTSQQGSANSLSYFGWINTTQENAKSNQFYNWMNVQDALSTKENPQYYDVGTQDNATRNYFPTGMHIQVASHHTQKLFTRIPEKIDQGSSNNLRRLAAVDAQATADSAALGKKVVKRASKSTAIGSSSTESNGNTLAYSNQNTSNTVAFFPTDVNDSCVVQAHAMHGGPQQINLCGVSSIAMARAIIGQSSIVRSAEKISLQDKRDLRFLKRREANRQSAKKSRTMKQALMNELKEKCASLTTEVEVLKAQNEQQVEECQKLRLEVASLKEKLGAAQPVQANGKAERDKGHLE